MKNNILFKGVMPALVTPVDASGKIKKDVLKKLVDWQISQGVSGFYICGSTGEGLLLSTAQREEMLEATLDAAGGRVPVIDHIGAMSQRDTIELARHAEKAGAAAISSIPPIYFAYTDEDVFTYYKKISESSSLPLVMYGYKGARDMPLSLIKKIMTLDTAIGIKWTFPDFYMMERIKQINGGNINVINGPDEMFVCGLSVGADAGIGTTYNIMPGLFVKSYNAFRAGDIARSTSLQHGINSVIERLFAHNVIATTKAMLEFLGFDVGQCTEPIHQLTKEEKAALWKSMEGVIDFERQDLNA